MNMFGASVANSVASIDVPGRYVPPFQGGVHPIQP